MQIEDFSSFDRLISVTTTVVMFCRRLMRTLQPETATLDQDDRVKAESLWIIDSQLVLVKEKAFSMWKSQFSLFQDDKGIWRCGGRIQNADLSYSAKHPILITRFHYLATLLVWRAHERVFHGGVKATLTELRSQFWIICGRSLVKHLIRKCVICRRYEGKPYGAPNPLPLPPFRVQKAPPTSTFPCTKGSTILLLWSGFRRTSLYQAGQWNSHNRYYYQGMDCIVHMLHYLCSTSRTCS